MSSFRSLKSNYKTLIKTLISPGKNLFYHHILKRRSFIAEKRMSFFFSFCPPALKASMAVEAAIAVPLFLFFFIIILFAFDALRLHGNLMAALHQTGNRMALYGYAYRQLSAGEEPLPGGLGSFMFSEGYARKEVIDYLGAEYLDHTCLAAGTGGLHFLRSSVMQENEVIELVASYRVQPFITFFGFTDFPMENRYYGRAWTGYDVEGRNESGEEDVLVYVAENGTVYHISRGCTYLNPSIEAVAHAAVGSMRNENGEKYYSCDRCSTYAYQAVVYITRQGNRVHGSVDCSGLRRTVHAVRLSQIKGKGRCTKCG